MEEWRHEDGERGTASMVGMNSWRTNGVERSIALKGKVLEDGHGAKQDELELLIEVPQVIQQLKRQNWRA
jgi:hypothetical protein